MGRPPCCDKVGIKKGPWTPEEDIILVSYIQEHGPGNWRSVPTNTGLLRCSKSCRLRWTNYLRPGIKRGNFTPHEEGMIIHLQALLGNKWAAIASYLPQRTDNDIKNYWNTHLKKKLKKLQSAMDPQEQSESSACHFESKSLNDKNGVVAETLAGVNKASTTYASSTENISRLLEGWMRSSPNTNALTTERPHQKSCFENPNAAMACAQHLGPKPERECGGGGDDDDQLVSHEEFDSILSFENLKNTSSSWDHKSTCESTPSCKDGEESIAEKQRSENAPPLSFLEKWLFEEAGAGQVEEMMELSPVF